MGTDLILLPFDADLSPIWYSRTVLSCVRRSDLFNDLMGLPSTPVPDSFMSYVGGSLDGDTKYGLTMETGRGDPLTYILVRTLLEYADHPSVRDNYQNKAIWAYLKELPPETKVALYWEA